MENLKTRVGRKYGFFVTFFSLENCEIFRISFIFLNLKEGSQKINY